MKRQQQLTDNQVRAIKNIQWLSYNDDNFRDLVGTNMTFEDVMSCGLWTMGELEERGTTDREYKLQYNHKSNAGNSFRGKRASKLKQEEQFMKKARALGKREKPIRRAVR
jgi:hypothetical protein